MNETKRAILKEIWPNGRDDAPGTGTPGSNPPEAIGVDVAIGGSWESPGSRSGGKRRGGGKNRGFSKGQVRWTGGYLSFRPVGMMVSSLKIHDFSALFLCPMVQWSCASRPEMIRLLTG